MDDFKSITVHVEEKYKLKFHNPTNYPSIGQGAHGVIFKISPEKCLKVYAKKEIAMKEAEAYRRIQGSPIAPKLYEVGHKYIIIEYIKGLNLKDELRMKGTITESTTKKILFLLEEMKKLGFTELDFELQNVFFVKKGPPKMVDYVKAFSRRSSKPKTLFKGLYRLDLLDPFLEQVKKMDRKKYLKWRRLMGEYFE